MLDVQHQRLTWVAQPLALAEALVSLGLVVVRKRRALLVALPSPVTYCILKNKVVGKGQHPLVYSEVDAPQVEHCLGNTYERPCAPPSGFQCLSTRARARQ